VREGLVLTAEASASCCGFAPHLLDSGPILRHKCFVIFMCAAIRVGVQIAVGVLRVVSCPRQV